LCVIGQGGVPRAPRPIGATLWGGLRTQKFPKNFFYFIFYIYLHMTFKEILRNCKRKLIDGDKKYIYKSRHTEEKKTRDTCKKQNK
jgi:hypothetical protein